MSDKKPKNRRDFIFTATAAAGVVGAAVVDNVDHGVVAVEETVEIDAALENVDD